MKRKGDLPGNIYYSIMSCFSGEDPVPYQNLLNAAVSDLKRERESPNHPKRNVYFEQYIDHYFNNNGNDLNAQERAALAGVYNILKQDLATVRYIEGDSLEDIISKAAGAAIRTTQAIGGFAAENFGVAVKAALGAFCLYNMAHSVVARSEQRGGGFQKEDVNVMLSAAGALVAAGVAIAGKDQYEKGTAKNSRMNKNIDKIVQHTKPRPKYI